MSEGPLGVKGCTTGSRLVTSERKRDFPEISCPRWIWGIWLVAYTAIMFPLSANQNYCQQEVFRVRSRRQKCSWSPVKKETLQASFGEVSPVKYLLICKFLFRKHPGGCHPVAATDVQQAQDIFEATNIENSPSGTFQAFIGNQTPNKCLASRASPAPSLKSSRVRLWLQQMRTACRSDFFS